MFSILFRVRHLDEDMASGTQHASRLGQQTQQVSNVLQHMEITQQSE